MNVLNRPEPSQTAKCLFYAFYFDGSINRISIMESNQFPYGLSEQELLAINPKQEPLTIEALRSYEGFENLTDEQAQELLFSIHAITTLLYDLLSTEESAELNSISNQKLAA